MRADGDAQTWLIGLTDLLYSNKQVAHDAANIGLSDIHAINASYVSTHYQTVSAKIS